MKKEKDLFSKSTKIFIIIILLLNSFLASKKIFAQTESSTSTEDFLLAEEKQKNPETFDPQVIKKEISSMLKTFSNIESEQQESETAGALSSDEEIQAIAIEQTETNNEMDTEDELIEDNEENNLEDIENLQADDLLDIFFKIDEQAGALSADENNGIGELKLINKKIIKEQQNIQTQKIFFNSSNNNGDTTLLSTNDQTPQYYEGIEERPYELAILSLYQSQNSNGSFGNLEEDQLLDSFWTAYILDSLGIKKDHVVLKNTLNFLTAINPQNTVEEIIYIWALSKNNQNYSEQLENLLKKQQRDGGFPLYEYFFSDPYTSSFFTILINIPNIPEGNIDKFLNYLETLHDTSGAITINNKTHIPLTFNMQAFLNNLDYDFYIKTGTQALTLKNELTDFLESIDEEQRKELEISDQLYLEGLLPISEQRIKETIEKLNNSSGQIDNSHQIIAKGLYVLKQYENLTAPQAQIIGPSTLYGIVRQDFVQNYIVQGITINSASLKNAPRGFRLYFDKNNQLLQIKGRSYRNINQTMELILKGNVNQTTNLEIPIKIINLKIVTPTNNIGIKNGEVIIKWEANADSEINLDYLVEIGNDSEIIAQYEGTKKIVKFSPPQTDQAYWFRIRARNNKVPITSTKGHFYYLGENDSFIHGQLFLKIKKDQPFESQYQIIAPRIYFPRSIKLKNRPQGLTIDRRRWWSSDFTIKGKVADVGSGKIEVEVKNYNGKIKIYDIDYEVDD